MPHTVWVFIFSPTLIMCCCFLFVRTYDILYNYMTYTSKHYHTVVLDYNFANYEFSSTRYLHQSAFFLTFSCNNECTHLWCCRYWWCSTNLSIIRDYTQYCHRYWQCFTNSVDGLLMSTHHIVAFRPFLTHVFMNMNTTNT